MTIHTLAALAVYIYFIYTHISEASYGIMSIHEFWLKIWCSAVRFHFDHSGEAIIQMAEHHGARFVYAVACVSLWCLVNFPKHHAFNHLVVDLISWAVVFFQPSQLRGWESFDGLCLKPGTTIAYPCLFLILNSPHLFDVSNLLYFTPAQTRQYCRATCKALAPSWCFHCTCTGMRADQSLDNRHSSCEVA